MPSSGRNSTRRSADTWRPPQTRLQSSSYGAGSGSRPRLQLCCEPSSAQVAARDPELDRAAAAMAAAAAEFVLIGGFAVIANRYVRATEDIDFLVPDSDENDLRVLAALNALGGVRLQDDAPLQPAQLLGRPHLRAKTEAGLIDIMRGGLPPLDYDTVRGRAIIADYGDVRLLVAGLSSIVAFKRLAGRPRDRNDLAGLEEIHGELPYEPIAGLDH